VGGIGEVVHLQNLPFLHLHPHFDLVKIVTNTLFPLWMSLRILKMESCSFVCDFLRQVCFLLTFSPLTVVDGLVNY
jgi:hypothetical protein